MKSSFSILLLAAAFQGAVLQKEWACSNPTPAECMDISVCDSITCPLSNETKCCVELIDRKCTATILEWPSLIDVTNQCIKGRGSCSTKKCPEQMTCIEEVLESPTSGIRNVKASCILMEINRIPSSCNDIDCWENSTCVVSETALGTKAECKNIWPKSCADIECDSGMQCVERKIPRCIPIRPSLTPIDCSQLECPEDLICMLWDKSTGPKCAKVPSATSCKELNCTRDLICKTMKDTTEVKCAGQIDRDCDTLDCELGNECKLIVNRTLDRNLLPVATCWPTQCPRLRTPATCDQIKCKNDEICVLCGEGIMSRAWCMKNDLRTQLDEGKLEETMLISKTEDSTLTGIDRPSVISRLPISCDELICQPQIEQCQVLRLKNKTLPIALCLSEDTPDKCKDITCNRETEKCEIWENKNWKVARCVPIESATPINGTWWALAEKCEELKCGLESECMQWIKNGTKKALCMKLRGDATCRIPSNKLIQKRNADGKLKIIIAANPDRLELPARNKSWRSWNLPDRCMERTCCEGEICTVRNGVALCIPENRWDRAQTWAPRTWAQTCGELLCKKGLECIMRRKENGLSKGAICSPIRRRNRINPTIAPSNLPEVPTSTGRRPRPIKPKM